MCPSKISLPIIVIILVICRFAHCSSTMGIKIRNYDNEKTKKIRNNDRKLSGKEGLKEIVVGEGNIISLPSPEMYKNSASYGFMFDLRAIKMVTVTEFHFYTRTADEVKYALYTVQGDYVLSKHNINLWSLIASGTANSHGVEKPTVIDKMTSIRISADSVQAFYITLQTQNLVYLSTDKGLDENFIWNDAVAITTGSGVSSYPLGVTFFEPKSWCGFINYYIMDYESLAPSLSPTLMPSITVVTPTPIPTDYPTDIFQYLSTNQTFTLFGSDLVYMNQNTELAFCNEIQVALKQHFTKTHFKTLEIQSISAFNQLLRGTEYNEVSIFMNATLNSPMDMDLSSVIKSSITELRQTILINLQRDNSEYFHNVKRIVSVATPELEKDYQIANVNQNISLIYLEEYSSLNLMEVFTVIKFEDEICNFFDREISKMNKNYFTVMAYVTSQTFSHDKHSLDISIEIQAKYLPPPNDFDVLSAIQSIINEENQGLYFKLKESNIAVFQELKSVNYITPTEPDKLSSSPPLTTVSDGGNSESFPLTTNSIKDFVMSTTGYIVTGVAAFAIVAIFIAISCCCCKCCRSGGNGGYKEAINKVLDDRTWAMSRMSGSYGRDNYVNNNYTTRSGRKYSM